MKITKRILKQIIKEELQNLKKESSDESHEGGMTHGEPRTDVDTDVDPEHMTHGEYFVWDDGPAGMAAVLDEFSVAIRQARDDGISPMDIRAFVEQVLGPAQSDEIIDV